MKTFVRILFLLSFISAMAQPTARELLQLDRDSLLERAGATLKKLLPEICSEKKGFDKQKFERISLRSCSDDHLTISFEYAFKYVVDSTKPKVYNVSVDLVQNTASYEVLPHVSHVDVRLIPLYTPDKTSRAAFLEIMEAYKRVNAPMADSVLHKTMVAGSSWEVFNKEEYYELRIESDSTSGRARVHKETLKISDEQHKHYAQDSSSIPCLQEVVWEQYNFPSAPVYLLNDVPVSREAFEKFLATLKENPNTWFCAETTTGGITGYSANDVEGVTYQVRFTSEEERNTNSIAGIK